MVNLKTAVIGVGHLGRFHAQKYASLPGSQLLGVIDTDEKRARYVAEELDVPSYSSIEKLPEKPDAVSIAVPTIHHHVTARQCLERGIHVLLEKPFASSIEEARDLLELSEKRNLCLQIGHLERFNPVFRKFQGTVQRPQFIESIRIAPFPKRGTDVDVILVLMIHDIDLVLSLLRSLPVQVEANGVSILTQTTDLANARLRFPCGCVVNMTASRVSDKAERKMRIFQKGNYLSMDFCSSRARRLQVDPGKPVDAEKLNPEDVQLGKGDALKSEIESFLQSAATGSRPIVSGENGLAAMRVALDITEQL